MQLSRIGPIALEEPLGESADSNVLRGLHLERNMAMAVKLLPRSLVNQAMGGDTFTDDVKTLQKLVHPNIARTYGGAMDNGQPYLAMELVRGESLRRRLDRRGRLPWETAIDMAERVCQALEFAHAAGQTHQRLTPDRILLTDAGGVKVIGFDCKLADQDGVLGLRSPMSVAHYLAPEEFRGRTSASLPTCDLFSLGVILYECLTGELPWPANSPAELIEARRQGPAPRVSTVVLDCPVWLDVLVARLLELKRGDRLQTADETRRAILDAKRKASQGVGAVQHAWSGRQGALATGADSRELSELRRKQTAPRERNDGSFYEQAWFLAACLAAVIAAGVWFMWPKSEDELFASAQPLMASDDPVQWRRAKEQYLSKLLERFPETKYSDQIDEFEERYAVHRAQERVKNIDRFGRKPASDLERRYAEGWRFERFGDHAAAWKLYDEVVAKAPTEPTIDERALVRLARDGVGRIKTQADAQQDEHEFIAGRLARASELIDQGELLQARKLLVELVGLYDGNEHLSDQVNEARSQITRIDSQSAE